VSACSSKTWTFDYKKIFLISIIHPKEILSMVDSVDLSLYNYDSFVPEKFGPWMRFHESPPLGKPAPDFPLWDLDENETSLSQVWSQHSLTIVEFGSFT
jgi:hypothetical protein